ncbi:MAG TPA: hypothetical protein VJX67_15620 [Blastocatellia bacterium]|nr:hypothetical protein [Blastocatellia bacterium]
MDTICCLLLLVLVIPGTIRVEAAQGVAPHSMAVAQSEPKDIRETFLALPRPKRIDELFAGMINDSAARKRLLDNTDFSDGVSVLDIPNGYLKIDVKIAGEGSSADRHGYIVVTSFTKRNHDRLVVLQLTNLNDYPDTVVEDHYYLLSGATCVEEAGSNFLPSISFFGDFWGEQPLPATQVKEYVKNLGEGSYYNIEWPRHGTVAKANSLIPYSDTDSKEQRTVERILGKRQYKTMELIWDKDRGSFVKGAKTRNR